MSIRINVPPVFYQHTNNQQVVEVTGNTVGQCLKQFIKQFPETKPLLFDQDEELHAYLDIYLNRESTYPEILARLVKDGDELHIIFLISGG